MTNFQQKVYAVVRGIPSGKVLSYGAVAALAGRPQAARAVGSALAALPDDSGVPWWRVVSHAGRITTPRIFHVAQLQRILLKREGVVFRSDRVDMARHAWQPASLPAALPTVKHSR